MKLSETTVSVLKNYASINSNMVFKAGNTVKTMAESKTIMASSNIAEDMSSEFGVYDLNEFLGVISMFEEPEIEISDDCKFATIAQNNRKIKYFFSSPENLTTPSKDVVMPSVDVSFNITQEDMANLRKASSTLGVTDVVVKGEPGANTATLAVTDVRDATANSYEIELTDCSRSDEGFQLIFNIGNFKFLNGDYSVEISKKLISHFTNQVDPIEYWVALEKNSSYGEL